MAISRAQKSRSIVVSVLLHLAVFAMLGLTVDFRSRTITPVAPTPIVQATAVDAEQVDAEVRRIEAQKQAQVAEEAERQRRLEQQARDAQRRRQQEEQRLAQVQEERVRAEEARKQEELRLAQERQKVEEQRREREAEQQREQARLAEEKRKAEAEQQRAAEAARAKAEEEQRRAEEARKQAEEARRAKELADALAAEEAERQAVQDQSEINRYAGLIKARIQQEFTSPAPGQGLKCVLRIRLIPGGDASEPIVIQSSGNPVFDRQAQLAVLKAVPLPVPQDPRLFRLMQTIDLEFNPP